MDHFSNRALQQFRDEVGVKFQLYNSLFTSLPFHRIEKTGILLSLLSSNCEEGYAGGAAPEEIIRSFFEKHTSYVTSREKNDLLFRFVQYVERQVVLFDALEDAAFRNVNDMNGPGTMKQLGSDVIQQDKTRQLAAKLGDFNVRLVLTAHPTQFYPGSVLGIINDLAKALAENHTAKVNTYLQQLGKTAFFKKKKPTPYDEAISLIWYMENVFYSAAGKIASELKNGFPNTVDPANPVIRMGFWPGGDRDGNPFVTASITTQVAQALKGSIMKCYYLDVRKLRRRLTFEGVEELLQELESKLYNNLFIPGMSTDLSKKEILDILTRISAIIQSQHNGLFLHMVNSLIDKIELFGLHFATLDVRQESSMHTKAIESLAGKHKDIPADYSKLSEEEKIRILGSISAPENLSPGEQLADEMETVNAIMDIQSSNGEEGCNRYIISQCNSALNAMEVYSLFLLHGLKKEDIHVDVVPLFETVDDLRNAADVMRKLYTDPVYRQHLALRKKRQTIMLGFSDGTKDGGYLMANWSIYRAKEELTAVSRQHGIDVIFFDGRGGPPSRGGGKTHKFYASMGRNISNKEIQLTIQGQTVSSNFGTVDTARYNIEQLLNAGISNTLFSDREITFTEKEESLMRELSDVSFQEYKKLRDHPYLADYLLQVSPLRFYSETNIGSRPAKRGSASGLSLKDLRAVPFAGSWSQLKQNVTGYYGVGSALKLMEEKGRLLEVQKLYHQSLFFRTLIDNCEMAMMKSYFPVTAYLEDHEQFGGIWKMIKDEYELTKEYLAKITGQHTLMAEYPVEQLSIQMRERIVLPLVTIQQYALTRIREMEETDPELKATYEKLVMRCSFGIINAGRNSA